MYENDWIIMQLARERRRDLLRQLEHEKLVREAEAIPHEQGHALYHVLDRVGKYLITWGEWLQARHAAYHTSLSTPQEVYHG